MSREAEPERPGDRRGIQSIEIGLRVIDALRSADGPLTLTEVARGAAIPASNCHRYLVSFCRSGFLSQDPVSGRYDLGPGLLQAGLVAASRLDPVAIGNEALLDAVAATGRSGLLAVWTERGPVIVRWLGGRDNLRTSIAIGATLPLLTSATGRAFLSHLPSFQTGDLAAAEVKRNGGTAPSLPDPLLRDGLAEVHGIHIPGLSAIAAPIVDHNDEAAVVVGLIGLLDTMTASDRVALLRSTAAASVRLGALPRREAVPPATRPSP